MIVLPGLLVALVVAGTSTPEARAVSSALKACMNSGDAAQGVTGAMEACTQDELKRRDAILNRTYRDSMGRIPEPERIRLRTAQRAWIKRRDAACKPNLAADKGSLGGLDYLDCMIDQTINQTVRLAKAR